MTFEVIKLAVGGGQWCILEEKRNWLIKHEKWQLWKVERNRSDSKLLFAEEMCTSFKTNKIKFERWFNYNILKDPVNIK